MVGTVQAQIRALGPFSPTRLAQREERESRLGVRRSVSLSAWNNSSGQTSSERKQLDL